MKNGTMEETARCDGFPSRGYIVIFTACLLALTLLLFRKHHQPDPSDPASSETGPIPVVNQVGQTSALTRPLSHAAANQPVLSAEEIVAGKVTQFARSRRKLAHEIAKHFNKSV